MKRDSAAESNGEQIYSTNEGPVLIAIDGNQVFTSESFDLTLARKLELLMVGAQVERESADRAGLRPAMPELSVGMANLIARCGLMRAGLTH